MEKKKLIKIKSRKSESSSQYSYSNMHFALIASPVNERIQCNSLTMCRETINKQVHIARNVDKNEVAEKSLIDFEKLRLLIVQDKNHDDYEEFKTKLFSGKALLNRYEEEAGWKPSKIATVNHPRYRNAWLLTGPKEWMSQPQLLSIPPFFLRLMSVHGPLNVNGTFQQAEASLKTLYTEYTIEKEKSKEKRDSFCFYSDIGSYLGYLDDLKLLILNTEEIFKSVELDDAWAQYKNKSEFGTLSGFLYFFTSSSIISYNKKVAGSKARFTKLKNAAKK